MEYANKHTVVNPTRTMTAITTHDTLRQSAKYISDFTRLLLLEGFSHLGLCEVTLGWINNFQNFEKSHKFQKLAKHFVKLKFFEKISKLFKL